MQRHYYELISIHDNHTFFSQSWWDWFYWFYFISRLFAISIAFSAHPCEGEIWGAIALLTWLVQAGERERERAVKHRLICFMWGRGEDKKKEKKKKKKKYWPFTGEECALVRTTSANETRCQWVHFAWQSIDTQVSHCLCNNIPPCWVVSDHYEWKYLVSCVIVHSITLFYCSRLRALLFTWPASLSLSLSLLFSRVQLLFLCFALLFFHSLPLALPVNLQMHVTQVTSCCWCTFKMQSTCNEARGRRERERDADTASHNLQLVAAQEWSLLHFALW